MQAVLALNSGINEFGQPNPETAGRIDAAMSYAAAKDIGTVIMVGGDADSMVDYVAEHNPSLCIVAESESKDTLEGAHFVKLNYLKPLGIDDVAVFTSNFHAPRTDWLYRRVLGNNLEITTHPVDSAIASNKMKVVKARELFQFAVVRAKLIGIGPDDDTKRAERLGKVRYRGVDTPLARSLVRLDGGSNIRRY